MGAGQETAGELRVHQCLDRLGRDQGAPIVYVRKR